MNYSYRKFKKTDFNEIFKIFLKFQEAIKIETIVCKDPKKPFSFKMKALLLEVFKEAKKDFKRSIVLCALGPRFKFDSYKSFVIRIFKPKIIKKSHFNKTIIMFND